MDASESSSDELLEAVSFISLRVQKRWTCGRTFKVIVADDSLSLNRPIVRSSGHRRLAWLRQLFVHSWLFDTRHIDVGQPTMCTSTDGNVRDRYAMSHIYA